MQTETKNPSVEAHKLRGVIANLSNEIALAERTIAGAEDASKRLALDVLLGKSTQADQETHRRDVAAARDTLGDKQAVLAAARDELRRLEAIETHDRREAAAIEARKLANDRIAAACRFDDAAREMQEAYEDFARLGIEIPNVGVMFKIPPGGMAQWEALRGHSRLDGALPDVVSVLHPNLIRAQRIPSLEQSEAALWRALLGE